MKLAIHGGKPVRAKPFPAFPVTGAAEEKAARRVLENGRWTTGLFTRVSGGSDQSFVRKFEKRFAADHEAKYAIASSNGTAGLAIALRAAGVDFGDEVLFQPYTCFANVEAVVQAGAVPVFVDIDPSSYCIDIGKIEERITSRTRAVVAIHWGGRPADMDGIRRVARRYGLAVIEDACVAQGAEWKGRKVGAIGDVGVFSFGCGKLVQCGEGGAIVTNNKALAQKCYDIRNRGRGPNSDAYTFGWNCRMSDIVAAILLEQWKRYPAQLRRRTGNALFLADLLRGVEGIELLEEDRRITQHAHCYFFFKFQEESFGVSRERFMEAMTAEGISVGGPRYPKPVYRFSFFEKGLIHGHCRRMGNPQRKSTYRAAHFPETECAYKKEALWFPHKYLFGTKKDVEDIAKAIIKIRENVHELK